MDRRERFQFVGQYRCLDFVNTKFTKEGGRRVDLMRSFADRSGHAADRIFQSALALREALLLMAEELAAHQPVPRASLEEINRTIGKRPGCVLLVRDSGRFEEMTRLNPDEPDHLMVPIAQSASDLLCHGDLALVRRCANPGCGAFFYDTSKNHTRRWCSTTGCGNRMRVAAHYRRSRTAV